MEQEASVVEQPDMDAIVLGEVVTDLPQDLYIPPDALRVFLETFQGPLDLLLYLIKKQNIDILDIPVAKITHQYMGYVEVMQGLQLELVGEYLLMAAMLTEIKSRLLLPKSKTEEEDDGLDPRAELVRRLQEYERFKTAAEKIDELERVDRDIYVADAQAPAMDLEHTRPAVELTEIMLAFREVLERAKLYESHQVTKEVLSIRERMTIVLQLIKSDSFTEFTTLFNALEGRMGVVVTLIAVLELIRQKVVELVQPEAFAPIYVKAKTV